MKEHTEQRIIGWGGLILTAMAIAVSGLAALIKGLTATIAVQLWVFLAAVFLAIAAVLWLVQQHRKQLETLTTQHKKECKEYDETLDEWEEAQKDWQAEYDKLAGAYTRLQEETAKANELVFQGGAYFRKSDSEHQQPFCRVCQDTKSRRVTVDEITEWDESTETRTVFYRCPSCNTTHRKQLMLEVPGGEEIPF